jgi:hypothetical protein
MQYARAALMLIGTLTVAGVTYAAFPDAHDPPPAGWTGPVFKLTRSWSDGEGPMRRSWVVLPLAGLLAVGVAGVAWARQGPPTVPPQYRDLVTRAAATCPGLDARLLAAQIEQESGWDSHAASPVGAQGIAQFMPAVWKAYGIDGDRDGVVDVWNPADAIPSAAHLDCVLMRDVADVPGDKVRNMLAAYNAGPQQVRRYSGVPPFPETRAYVAQVIARAAVLRLNA